MRVGVAHHFGWAIAVTANDRHEVVDRRRIELIEPGTPAAPIHHDGVSLDDETAQELEAAVRASALRATASALEELAADIDAPIVSLSLRRWPDDFPTDIAVLRRVPYEARADSVMYRQVLAECAGARGWAVHRFEARNVETRAAELLGDRADEVLHGPRARLGSPWTRDHRVALAATIVVGDPRSGAEGAE